MYTPEPIDTSDIQLPEELSALLESLAKNTHECWAKERLQQGWQWGPTRDDARKLHPCLVPYEELSAEEKAYDRITSAETLRLILRLGFRITRDDRDPT